MSVSAAASLLIFSDWSPYTSSQLAKKLEGLGITPQAGKPRRQAQLNLWELGPAWAPSSSSTASDAEGRLVELYGLRASEARALASKYCIVSDASADRTRLFDLIKLIFVYEFMVARPAGNNNTSFPAQTAKAEPSSASAAGAANTTAGNDSPSGSRKPFIPFAAVKPPLEVRTRALRDQAKTVRDSLDHFDRDLRSIIDMMENELSLAQETL